MALFINESWFCSNIFVAKSAIWLDENQVRNQMDHKFSPSYISRSFDEGSRKSDIQSFRNSVETQLRKVHNFSRKLHLCNTFCSKMRHMSPQIKHRTCECSSDISDTDLISFKKKEKTRVPKKGKQTNKVIKTPDKPSPSDLQAGDPIYGSQRTDDYQISGCQESLLETSTSQLWTFRTRSDRLLGNCRFSFRNQKLKV